MQAARGVLLYDECAVELTSSLGGSRLGGAIESPFTAVLVEAGHGAILTEWFRSAAAEEDRMRGKRFSNKGGSKPG
jgi:hypothetical protein